MAKLQSTNPATGDVLRSYDEYSDSAVSERVERSNRTFQEWRRLSFAERGARVNAVAARLRATVEEQAALMAREMGKPLAQGRAEIEKCASTCDYFGEHAERFLAPEMAQTEARKSFVTFQPLGVILGVMPWNFPYWQVFRFAAPTLMAGNTIVLKHAGNVCGCALAIEQLFRDAGFPDGAFSAVLVGSDRVASLIEHPLVRAVSLTGGTPAGRAVAGKAGSALKKQVLELGGSDPYLVLEDADLGLAVETCVAARLTNSGQSCVAAKRFIVVEPARRAFEERFVAAMRQQTMGDPFDPKTTVGPLARRDLRDGLHEQVRRTIEQGARLLLGGEVPPGPGAFYPPTVLADVRKGMGTYEEETFGPVASIIPVPDERRAIEAANDNQFGLGAAVFTADLQRGERIAAAELEAGACFVNQQVRSDPRLPFGGVKDSGYGRELSEFGIREFVNIKSVYIK
jgi:succinate-semialdehyde dehydrogenase/glutarate-semialdehyde dehydrogenase